MRQLKITKSITNRNDSFNIYLREVRKEESITPEEEVALAKRIKDGNVTAMQKLTSANLRFVISVAKQYQHQGLSLPDLINEGNLGLMIAAKKFDETRGFKFISYAVFWVRESILQALAENSRIVRLPLNQINNINRVNKTYQKLEQLNEVEPILEEVSNELQLNHKKLSHVVTIGKRHSSLDYCFEDDENKSLMDTIKNHNSPQPDSELISESIKKDLDRLITNVLSKKQEMVIRKLFGIGTEKKTYYQIMEETGLTRNAIDSRRRQALVALREKSQLLFS